MLRAFEDTAKTNPRHICFTAVDAAGREARYSYHRARLYGSALAQLLRAAGVARGHYVAVELPNGEAWPLLLLAAAYGNFALVGMDPHLTTAERMARYGEVEAAAGAPISYCVNRENVADLMAHAGRLIAGDDAVNPYAASFSGGSALVGEPARIGGPVRRRDPVRPGDPARRGGSVRSMRAAQAPLGAFPAQIHATPQASQIRRYSNDAEETIVHFADHAAHLFNAAKPAVVFFTAGVSGKSKMVSLTWKNLIGASQALNSVLCKPGRGVWQAVLPCYRVMGLQVMVRSLCNRSALVLYERFQPERLLADVNRLGATHVAVDDAMLQRLLACGKREALRSYRCVLLGGSDLPEADAAACKQLGINVYAGYGTTETAGHICIGLINDQFDGSLFLLPGYDARIQGAAPNGFGRLLVKGPGVCDRYLGMRAPLTVQGFLPTGDVAKYHAGRIAIHKRTETMFLCGDTYVFPDEIRENICALKGVSDSYVFGAPHSSLGACPVAFVECCDRMAANRPSNREFAASVRRRLAGRLSDACMPRHVFALDSFPRTSAGCVDGALLERCYAERLEVAKVKIHRIAVPLLAPTRIGGSVCRERASLVVELIDYAGRVGLGECVAFSRDDAGFETLQEAKGYLADVLAPCVVGQAFLHPSEVFPALLECFGAVGHPRSLGALEPAFWDLYGKVSKLAFWQLIGGKAPAGAGLSPAVPSAPGASPGASAAPATCAPSALCRVRTSALIGVVGTRETVEQVWRCCEAGYSCVTIEVRPKMAYQRVRAVRTVFPDVMITVDAKQSFSDADVAELRALDELNVAWIEEPLAFADNATAKQRFARLSRFQRTLRTLLCLDESIATLQDAYLALDYPDLRYMVARVGEFGGVRPTLDFIACACARGVRIWMGGMFDLGISRRMHAAFQTLPSVEDAGNTGSVLRQFASDIADPPHTVERGLVTLNKASAPFGVGCDLDWRQIRHYLMESITVG